MNSMNKNALNILQEAMRREDLNILTGKIGKATIADMGVKTVGGYNAGIYLSRIALGGLGDVNISYKKYGELAIPTVTIHTDHPIEACIASQLAGWRIKVGDYFAMGSGPARILARKPRKIYEVIGYSEKSDEAVLLLETEKLPGKKVIEYISDETGVDEPNLYIALVSTNSLAGSVQVAARIVETAIYKLYILGFDIRKIRFGVGMAPIAPLEPNSLIMLGKTNDMLLYGGEVSLYIEYDDENVLKKFVEETPSSSSKDYGILLSKKISEVGIEFLYKIEPKLFSPAAITVYNIKSGHTFKAGKVNYEIIQEILKIKNGL